MTFKYCLRILLVSIVVNTGYAEENAIHINTPRGGWTYSTTGESDFLQDVHYPASRVNVGENKKAQIAGRIKITAKSEPYSLVLNVNGAVMPLEVNPDGTFARPYAFGRGSNGIEIRDPQTKQLSRVQFYENNIARAPAKLRVVLAWDSSGTDLDLHVISPDGQHVFYGDRVVGNGGALDVDVTTGYGPEIYANPSPPHGPYHVYVNYYGSGVQNEILTTASVTVITDENTVNERKQMFRVPMRNAGELMLVKSFYY